MALFIRERSRNPEGQEYVEVEEIDGSGDYRFAIDGNWDGRQFHEIPSNALHTEHLNVKYKAIYHHLEERFPLVTVPRFFKARISPKGEYIPSKSEHLTGWDNVKDYQPDLIVLEEETYRILQHGNYSNGHGGWHFSIQDLGDLSMFENKVVAGETERDGKLRVSLSGDAPHHTNPGRYWRAWIDYSGENPGKAVREVADYLNSEKERLGVPLWKKVSE